MKSRKWQRKLDQYSSVILKIRAPIILLDLKHPAKTHKELEKREAKMNKNTPKEDLKNIIIEQIKAGNAWKLKKNSQNLYISCQNELILIENYKGSWFLPKCLVRSNE